MLVVGLGSQQRYTEEKSEEQTSHDRGIMGARRRRLQFDIANREAMDESAEWRLRYDEEVDRTNKCLQQLQLFRESSQKGEDASGINHELTILQKENAVLLERLETLKRELEEERLKCSSRYMN
ncbi:hypothetical protein JHK87_036145 [Glycine soja]|nr:hypothetical protein JHK87_036145 [Glycine soja]